MIKGNSYMLVFSMLMLLLIVLVSTTPIMIKALLAVLTIAFYFPAIRKLLFKDKFRKIKVALYSSLSFTIGLLLLSAFDEPSSTLTGDTLSSMIVVLFYNVMGNFIYGLPASLLAELISIRFFAIRIWLSGFIHIGFGLITYFIMPGLFIPAIICAILFFALDEITKPHLTNIVP
ncbi:hypothetical protein GW626_17425 [Peribacillus muralis]|uniref:hypothetical protein n=1 Tax=Peribacillus muralis TaxID=264697 RepID=UPI001F4E7399|nr:hypothetical protein [Peribacillus muralis]MCK1992135.1 hypothetical protein [Peribacillus muralis]MCK2012691.1 hypothetical protein [Peribacillus muralis]